MGQGLLSEWKLVISASHGLVLGPALFSIFDDDTCREIECTLREFDSNNKLSGMVDMLEGSDVTQKDLDRTERCEPMPIS